MHRRWLFLMFCVALVPALSVVAAGPNTAPKKPGLAPAPAPIDPETDTTLLTIKAAIVPSDRQMAKIIELYTKLRQDQHNVMREIHDAHFPPAIEGGDGVRGWGGDGGNGGDGGGAGGGKGGKGGAGSGPIGGNKDAEPEEPSAAQRDAFIKDAQKSIKPLNDEFLKQCESMLQPQQKEMWNTLTGAIDLMPKPLRKGGDGLAPEKGPKPGEQAPGFELQDLNGKPVSLESLRGKPLVIEFGSYTCPIFRNKTDTIEQIRQEFGSTVNWVLIYVMEAHPTDGWVVPINTHEGIELPQHTSMEKRIECARLAKEKLNLNVHVLVDSFDNATTKAWFGAPNRAYVLDAQGKVVSKQLWADPAKIRQALMDLMAKPG